jgi:hypothetical protein
MSFSSSLSPTALLKADYGSELRVAFIPSIVGRLIPMNQIRSHDFSEELISFLNIRETTPAGSIPNATVRSFNANISSNTLFDSH